MHSRRRSNSKRRSESRTRSQIKVPVIRCYYRVLKTTVKDVDGEHDYSELFSVICEIIGKAQFGSILHLSPLVEAIKDLSASHRERKTCFNLICLLSHLVFQLKAEKIVLTEENDANGKQIKGGIMLDNKQYES